MERRYSEPTINKTEFNCPRCGVRAPQAWQRLYCRALNEGETPLRITHDWIAEIVNQRNPDEKPLSPKMLKAWKKIADGDVVHEEQSSDIYAYHIFNLDAAICQHCKGLSIWLNDNMVYPLGGEVPAHDDMPDAVKPTFSESSKILSASPRASAALARLALQQLCVELGAEKHKLDDQIGELVAQGLSPEIQKMLDSVRVIGNNAVHPGEIDLKDDHQTAKFLLECINRICQRLITEKREVDDLYNMLPQGARDAVDKRNVKLAPPPPPENAE